MNHVFLSGIVETVPVLLSKESQTPHACMDLIVSHQTSNGTEKKEHYPIHAWHNVALSMLHTVKPTSQVSIKGYLCQQHIGCEARVYVTAEEFHVSAKQPRRPARRNAVLASNQEKRVDENTQILNSSPVIEEIETTCNETA